MKLWVLDSNLLFKLVEGSDPALLPRLQKLAADAAAVEADLAISAVTVQEYLVRPAQLGQDQWHRARHDLDDFVVLQFDRAAAEEAAKVVRAMKHYVEAAATKTQGKRLWFRDAAIVGTALARGAEAVFTHDGPMLKMAKPSLPIHRI